MIEEALPAPGMGCTGCERTLQTFLEELDGVDDVRPDYRHGVVKVHYDAERITRRQVQEQIRQAGYGA